MRPEITRARHGPNQPATGRGNRQTSPRSGLSGRAKPQPGQRRFEHRPETTDIPHILLLAIKGEALGNQAEGITQLDLAAREAEAAGYDDGALRALTALLRASANPEVQARYDAALTRLTTRT
ncbi:hypothetical protein [Streptomyces sp. AGS-58]|uniref:hypothetical protein n=1 Tax=unclassified Streptomyces TaxID=2593676 RepID=UPI0035A305E9